MWLLLCTIFQLSIYHLKNDKGVYLKKCDKKMTVEAMKKVVRNRESVPYRKNGNVKFDTKLVSAILEQVSKSPLHSSTSPAIPNCSEGKNLNSGLSHSTFKNQF